MPCHRPRWRVATRASRDGDRLLLGMKRHQRVRAGDHPVARTSAKTSTIESEALTTCRVSIPIGYACGTRHVGLGLDPRSAAAGSESGLDVRVRELGSLPPSAVTAGWRRRISHFPYPGRDSRTLTSFGGDGRSGMPYARLHRRILKAASACTGLRPAGRAKRTSIVDAAHASRLWPPQADGFVEVFLEITARATSWLGRNTSAIEALLAWPAPTARWATREPDLGSACRCTAGLASGCARCGHRLNVVSAGRYPRPDLPITDRRRTATSSERRLPSASAASAIDATTIAAEMLRAVAPAQRSRAAEGPSACR